MVTEFDAVPERVPDWNRHPLLASEMHHTKCMTSHTSWIPPTPPLLCRLQGELYGEVDRGRCHFSVAKLLLLAVRRTRAACRKTPFRLDHLSRRFGGCSSTTDLGPEPTAQRASASAASYECCLCSLSGGVAFTGCSGLAQAGPSGAERSGPPVKVAAEYHWVHSSAARTGDDVGDKVRLPLAFGG